MLAHLLVALALVGPAVCQLPTTPAPAQSVLLSANITSLKNNVEFVAVSFQGAQVTPGDAIAFVQNASTTNYSVKPPQKFKWVVTSNTSDALTTGAGSIV